MLYVCVLCVFRSLFWFLVYGYKAVHVVCEQGVTINKIEVAMNRWHLSMGGELDVESFGIDR